MIVSDPVRDPPASTSVIAPVPRISVQAFCETPDVASVINEAAADRRVSKAHIKVHMGGAPAAVEAYRAAPTPNVIVIEGNANRGELMDRLEALSGFCDAGTKVVVVGSINDIALYRDLIARGVSEYVVMPFDALDFVRSISSLYTATGSEPVGRVIAVMGAKGGVGASTIAHNVAWSIARNLDTATVIADMDLPFGTGGLDFNQDPPQGIAEAVFAPDRIDSNLVDRLLSKCSEKLSILASPATLDRLYDFSEGAFEPLVDILRGSVPAVMLDVPHGWTGWTRRTLTIADEVVIVATPDLANLRNAKNILDTIRAARPNDAPPRLILNQTGVPKRPEITTADFAKAVDAEPIAVISFEPKLFGTAANNGQMIAEVEAGARAAEQFNEVARMVTGRSEARRGKKTLFDPIMARLKSRKAS